VPGAALIAMQMTLARAITLSGVALHAGVAVSCRVAPAAAGAGISFVRADVDGAAPVPAQHAYVRSTTLATTLALRAGSPPVSTVEHVLAALLGSRVDNALVQVRGAELPIADGSALPFCEAFREAGLEQLHGSRRKFVRVNVAVRVELPDGSWAELAPPELEAEAEAEAESEPRRGGRERRCSRRLSLSVQLDYPHVAAISGRAFAAADCHDSSYFWRELAPARTFALEADVARMRAAGMALGGGLENAVVFGEENGGSVLNDGGLRFDDEPARHKALDAAGDLLLLAPPGGCLVGRFRSFRPGHTLLHALREKALGTLEPA